MKECYVLKPAEIEAYPHGQHTDLIMRKNIQQTEDEEHGTRWECEEVQMRVTGPVDLTDVKDRFDWWWAAASGLDKIRGEKLLELSAACNASIVAGVDVEMGGEVYHFSLKTEDQLNLMSLQAMVMAGQTAVPYHADGQECRFFSAEEFNLIATAATNWKLYHESYYNSMRSYINTLEDAATINAISYGDAVPVEYQTAVLQQLIAVMGASIV